MGLGQGEMIPGPRNQSLGKVELRQRKTRQHVYTSSCYSNIQIKASAPAVPSNPRKPERNGMTQSPTKYVTQIRKQEGWGGEVEVVGGRGLCACVLCISSCKRRRALMRRLFLQPPGATSGVNGASGGETVQEVKLQHSDVSLMFLHSALLSDRTSAEVEVNLPMLTRGQDVTHVYLKVSVR